MTRITAEQLNSVREWIAEFGAKLGALADKAAAGGEVTALDVAEHLFNEEFPEELRTAAAAAGDAELREQVTSGLRVPRAPSTGKKVKAAVKPNGGRK